MCTAIRFTDASGSALYMGRNLDWSCGYGEHIVVVPRGLQIARSFGDPFAARGAVVGMGIVADGIPLYFDCANEDGLAVAGLNFPGFARYEEEAVAGKNNIAAFEFPLWVAASFTSVDEVEDALATIAIVGKPAGLGLGVSLLHWMVTDARRSIAVEYTRDGMHVFHDDVGVLTNQPGFDWQRQNLRNYLTLTPEVPPAATWGSAELVPYGAGVGMRGLPGDPSSTSRFVRAAATNAFYPAKDSEQDNVARLFRTLGNVAMPEGLALMASGDFEKTVYTGGYSARTQTYYWSTYDDPTIRKVCLADHADGTELYEPRPERPASGTCAG